MARRASSGSSVASDGPSVPSSERLPLALRALAAFWAIVVVGIAGGVTTLAVLGPVAPRVAGIAPHDAKPEAAAQAGVQAAPHGQGTAAGGAVPDAAPAPRQAAPAPRLAGARVPAPDPGLQEPSLAFAPYTLPRIGEDGRTPLQAYAAGVNLPDERPRVAILLAGLGMSALDTEAAITQLPPAVSLAITPYATRNDRLLDLARQTGHELFMSLALEPSGNYLNDAGPQTLLTSQSPVVNAARLEWTLSRFPGYAGAVGALGGMRGERFAASDQMNLVLQEMLKRGLGYIDPRPGATLQALPRTRLPAMRGVDVVIDEPGVRFEIEGKLARLEQVARDRGSAVGFAGMPTPVTVERLTAWSATLGQRNIVLVPVSALVRPAGRQQGSGEAGTSTAANPVH